MDETLKEMEDNDELISPIFGVAATLAVFLVLSLFTGIDASVGEWSFAENVGPVVGVILALIAVGLLTE